MEYAEAVSILGGPLEPSDGEARNGWDRESLTVYHAERELEVSKAILNRAPSRPDSTTNNMKWLRGGFSRG